LRVRATGVVFDAVFTYSDSIVEEQAIDEHCYLLTQSSLTSRA
jgi:hypothetical protein